MGNKNSKNSSSHFHDAPPPPQIATETKAEQTEPDVFITVRSIWFSSVGDPLQTLVLKVKATYTIARLKQIIQNEALKTGRQVIPWNEQKLLYKGKPLENDKVLADYEIDDFIRLIKEEPTATAVELSEPDAVLPSHPVAVARTSVASGDEKKATPSRVAAAAVKVGQFPAPLPAPPLPVISSPQSHPPGGLSFKST